MKNLIGKNWRKVMFTLTLIVLLLPIMMLPASAINGSLSDTSIEISEDTSNKWTATGTTVSGTVSGDKWLGIVSRTNNTTLTIKNTKQKAANLSFTLSATSVAGSIEINGSKITLDKDSNGKFLPKNCIYTIQAGGTLKVKLVSGNGSGATTVSMSNIQLVVDETVSVQFNKPEGGSYTVKTTEGQQSITENKIISTKGAFTVNATPASGNVFLFWRDQNGKSISQSANVQMDADTLDGVTEVTPIFVKKETPAFYIAGHKDTIYYGENALQEVIDASENSDTIVPVIDCTVTGDYTLKGNRKLLIPYNANDTYMTVADTSCTAGWSAPKPYRTLTLNGTLTVQETASISVGALHATQNSQVGAPTGYYGKLVLPNENCKIEMQSGTNLYAYGYITGSGVVQIDSSANIYEYFQIAGWRGGTATSNMQNKSVFPFNQYYVQNVEANLYIASGATESVVSTVTAGGVTKSITIPYVGTQGLFQLSTGMLHRWYDAQTDRIHYDVIDGTMSLGSISIKVSIVNMNSANYALPLNSNISVHLIGNSTFNVTNDAELLPGVEVIVDKEAILTVASGKSLYVYDREEWIDDTWTCDPVPYVVNTKDGPVDRTWTATPPGRGYVSAGRTTYLIPAAYSPTRAFNRTAANALPDAKLVINGTLNVMGSLYTTEHGAEIISEGAGTVRLTNKPMTGELQEYWQELTLQTYNVDKKANESKTIAEGEYNSIIVKPAWLKNANGGYTQTAGADANTTYTYNQNDGMWHVYSAWNEAKPHTCTENGTLGHYTCELCVDSEGHPTKYFDEEYKVLETVEDPAAHNWGENGEGHIAAKAATCTEDGNQEYWHCLTCNKYFADDKGETEYTAENSWVIPATGHKYGKPVWSWNEDHTSATATFTCTNEGCKDEATGTAHVETVTTNEVAKTTTATCTAAGKDTYTATVNFNDTQYTGTYEIEAKALGHSFTNYIYNNDATCVKNGTKTAKCDRCDATDTMDDEAHPATGHTYGEPSWNWIETEGVWSATATFTCKNAGCTDEAVGHTKTEDAKVDEDTSKYVAPTCVAEGSKTYTATVTVGEASFTNTKVEEIPVDGTAHSWDDGEITTAPTCSAKGVMTYTCKHDSSHTKTGEVPIKEDAHNYVFDTWGDEWTEVNGVWTISANLKCSYNGAHTKTETVTAVKDADKSVAVGHLTDGKDVFTATYGDQTIDHTVDIKAEGHQLTHHDAVAATCTKTGNVEYWSCSVCNKNFADEACTNELTTVTTGIDPNDHDWDDGTITTPATCTEKGVKTYTCKHNSEHKKTEEVAIVPDAHDWDEGTITIPATCSKEGVKTFTCKHDSNHTKTEEVPIDDNAHKWGAWTETVVEGVSKHTHTCEYNSQHTETAEHRFDGWVIGTEATCGVAGSKHRVCKDCGYRENGEIEATGNHTWSTEWTTDGENHWHECTTCGAVNDKAEHTEVIDEAVAATCQQTGLTEGSHCSVCVKVLVAQEETPVDSDAHTWAEEFTIDTPATCTEAGSKSRHCTNEGCTAKTDVIVIDATGEHTWGDWTTKTAATCTENKVETRECSVCHYSEDQEVSNSATGHQHVTKTEAQNGTCKTEGNIAYWTCSDCKTKFSDEACTIVVTSVSTDKDPTNHAGDTEIRGAESATCVAGGYTGDTWCLGCNTKIADGSIIPALGHDSEGVVAPRNATCTEDGVVGGTYCTRCHEGESEARKPIEKLGHQYTSEVTNPTCTEKGYTTHTCSRCDNSYVDSWTDEIEHSWDEGEVIREPTETQPGTKKFICTVCTENKMEDIPATGEHTYTSEVTTEPTCTQKGVKTYTCTDCGTTYTEDIDPLGHDYQDHEGKEPTCGADGWKAYQTCSRCEYSNYELIHATGEHASAVPVRENEVPATCSAAGSYDEVVYCSVCGEKLSSTHRIIEKLAHTPAAPVRENEVPATYDAAGSYDEVVYCSACHTELSRETKTIPQLTRPVDPNPPVNPDPGPVGPVGPVNPPVTPVDPTPSPAPSEEPEENLEENDVPLGETPVELESGLLRLPVSVAGDVVVRADGTIVTKSLVEGEMAYFLLNEPASVRIISNARRFIDVRKDDWFAPAVSFVSSHELFNGVSENEFAPNMAMNRAMMVTVLWRLEGCPQVEGTIPFADVAEGEWYTQAIRWAAQKGIVNGYENGCFGTWDDVTREQIAAILYRYMNVMGLDTEASTKLNAYADSEAVSDWAKSAMIWAVDRGIINGLTESLLAPQEDAARCQVATMLQRLVTNMVK